jgi:hypothetical protein
MKINYKKSLKFVTLLLTAIIIGAVSATTYRYMYIQGSITVSSAKLIWLAGADVPNTNITGSTASQAVSIEQGTPLNFTEALFLKNTNSTGSFSYNITITTPLSSSDFERAKMHVYENYTVPGSWSYLSTLDLTSSNSFYYNSALSAGNYLRMTLELNATIATGTRSFVVQVQYWA